MGSELFDPTAWRPVPGFEDFTDITYHRAIDQGTVRVAFNRPEIRNAFRPKTVDELYRALDHARMSSDVVASFSPGMARHREMVVGHSARAETNESAGRTATSTPTARLRTRLIPRVAAGSTFSKFSD